MVSKPEGDAGIDLYFPNDINVPARQSLLIDFEIQCEMIIIIDMLRLHLLSSSWDVPLRPFLTSSSLFSSLRRFSLTSLHLLRPALGDGVPVSFGAWACGANQSPLCWSPVGSQAFLTGWRPTFGVAQAWLRFSCPRPASPQAWLLFCTKIVQIGP